MAEGSFGLFALRSPSFSGKSPPSSAPALFPDFTLDELAEGVRRLDFEADDVLEEPACARTPPPTR